MQETSNLTAMRFAKHILVVPKFAEIIPGESLQLLQQLHVHSSLTAAVLQLAGMHITSSYISRWPMAL